MIPGVCACVRACVCLSVCLYILINEKLPFFRTLSCTHFPFAVTEAEVFRVMSECLTSVDVGKFIVKVNHRLLLGTELVVKLRIEGGIIEEIQ